VPIRRNATASNKPKSAPAIRYPSCGKISVECWIDCASCSLRFRLAAIRNFTAEKAARALDWRIIRGRWFCPKCVAEAERY
jgi:hypothetical protein